MCYSYKDSVISFIIPMVVVTLMLIRGLPFDYYFAPLIFVYSLVQLGEAIIWKNLEHKSLNNLGTKIILISLALNMFGLGLGIFINNNNIYPLLIGLIVGLFFIITRWNVKETIINKYGNLKWGVSTDFYLIILIISIFFSYSININIYQKTLAFLFFIITCIYYVIYKKIYLKQLNSDTLWCNIAALYSFIFLIIPYIC